MLHILYSCYNNYDLLIGENTRFIEKYRANIVIIDDHSTEIEQIKGKNFAEEKGVRFIINPRKGIQAAIDEYIKSYCKEKDWILVVQQDVFFRDSGAIERLERKVDAINRKGLNIGAFGFPNYVPDAHYHENYSEYSQVDWRNTWLGVFCLSDSRLYKSKSLKYLMFSIFSKVPFIQYIEKRFWHKVIFARNFAPKTLPNYEQTVGLYDGFSSIDLPVWTAVVISSRAWEKAIVADDNFVFHLWFPDIAMQLMNNDFYVCLDNSEIIVNNWKLKEKYGHLGSVDEGKKANGRMEPYGGHLKFWQKKWGYDYENPYPPKNLPIRPHSVLSRTMNKRTLAPLMKFDL